MSALAIWEFTSFGQNSVLAPREDVMAKLGGLCKKFVFQKERCETTGRLHYQGRMSLQKPVRLAGLVALLKGSPLAGSHLGPTTVGETKQQAWSYVMKEQTRVDGPWTEKDYRSPMPWHLEGIHREPYPFQGTLIDMIKADVKDPRGSHYILDPVGKKGKSILVSYLRWSKLACVVPPVKCADEMSAFVQKREDARWYVIDIPRQQDSFERFVEICRGVEQLKSGYSYDRRYDSQDRSNSLGCPNIICFGNDMPPWSKCDRGRWYLWLVDDQKRLIPFNQTIFDYQCRLYERQQAEMRSALRAFPAMTPYLFSAACDEMDTCQSGPLWDALVAEENLMSDDE